MATAKTTMLTAITKELYLPGLGDNIMEMNPLFAALHKKGIRKQSGTQINQPVRFAMNSGATSYDGADSITHQATTEDYAASFDWKQNVVPIYITGRDELINQGPEQVIDLVGEKVEVAKMSLAHDLSTQLYADGTGNSSKDIVGLGLAILYSGTYGGLDRSSYTWWKAKAYGNSAVDRELTLDLMSQARTAATQLSGKPNFIVTTRNLYTKLSSIANPMDRFFNTDTAKLGFDSIMFEGVPVYFDDDCTDKYMYMLNTNTLDFIIHTKNDFRFWGWHDSEGTDTKIARIYCHCALVCKEPRANAVIYDLLYTL